MEEMSIGEFARRSRLSAKRTTHCDFAVPFV